MIASIAVSAAVYAIDKPYSYKIPESMSLQPGMRVTVPFGRGNRRCEGLILSISDGEELGLKSIDGVLDDAPILSESYIRMAAFIRERYFCTFYDAVKAMLPAGLWFQTKGQFTLIETPVDMDSLKNTSEAAWLVMQLLLSHNGRIDEAALYASISDSETVDTGLSYLKKKKYIQSDVDFSRKILDKTEKIASLAVSAEEAMEFALRKKRSAPLQYEVLKLICAVGSGSTKEISYLTGAGMTTIRRLEALGYLQLSVRDVFRNSLPEAVIPADPVVLNFTQEAVFSGLLSQSRQEEPGVALIYGVTGSGKTAIYIRMIREMLQQERSSIFLVPEISLTPQLIQTLMSHFGEEVAVLHSALRVSERYDTWKRIKAGKARVVLGTRSAVFAPVSNLGLLIVDEEQEHSYKSENAPRYHAREIAIYRGSRENALVILGSATPSLESMYLAKNGVYKLYQLPDRYNGKHLPTVELVDMKQDLKDGNGSAISRHLADSLRENHALGRQSILFLNRRGAGKCMICVDCGEVIMCPRCSVSLTYHTANHRLMCHHCGFSQPIPDDCPHCSGHMKAIGTGTQKIQQELQALFPDTDILRMDADTVSASNTHDAILSKFQNEKIPFLIGTQMVTKGLNFENVTLVGVVDADSSLYVNHYRAAETTFSMLTQVIGRAGRGEHPGRAIIQTMTPEHSVIRLAARQDYSGFYNLELTLRELQKTPPYGDVFVIMFVGAFESQTISAAGAFRQMLEQSLHHPSYEGTQVRILGPSPASISKINNAYRYRITLHCTNQRSVRQLLAHLLREFTKNKSNKGVSVFVDINAYE